MFQSQPMKNLRPVRENCFGWWLSDLEDERPKVRPLGYSICRVCRTNDCNDAGIDEDIDKLRNQQLISTTSVPSREELSQLIRSGRLPHLQQYRNIIEKVLGSKSTIDDLPEECVALRTPSTTSTPSPVEVTDDVALIGAIEEAVRNGHIDEEFAVQVSRIRELSADLTELRATSRLLHRELRALDAAAATILSKVRSLRRDAEDLIFLEKMLAAAEGFFTLVPNNSNLII